MSAPWGNSEKIYSLGVLPPVTRFGHRHCAHKGGSISPLMIFTTCDASANSVAAIAKVTLTRLSLGTSSSIDNFCGVKPTRYNRKMTAVFFVMRFDAAPIVIWIRNCDQEIRAV